MKKFFVFALTLMAGAISMFAQDCVETDVNLTGTASITFIRHTHKILTGIFSVSDTSHVIFAQGNLQYQASTNTWRFAENQYDRIGNAAGNSTTDAETRANQEEWIDLFGYGTSGWNGSGATNYQPWTIETHSNYYLTKSLTGSYKEADWAYHNTIINGGIDRDGSSVHKWHVLTKDEWKYIFNRRDAENRELFGYGILMNIRGIFLLPDTSDWDWTIFDGETLFNKETWTPGLNSYTANMISNAEIWQKMENAGVVFLPATFYWDGSKVANELYGNYWSSTNNSNFSSYAIQFWSSNLNLEATRQKYYGEAVRPVYHLDY